MKTLSWPWIAALAAAVVLNVATFPPPWMVALPGLSFRHGLVHDAGVDGALDGDAGGRGRGHGRLVRHAAHVGTSRVCRSRAR